MKRGGQGLAREQLARPGLGLIFKSGGEARATADRVAQALAVVEEGAAALLGAQEAFLFERRDCGAHRVPVDPETGGQFRLRRQPLVGCQSCENRLANLVGDLPPERDPGPSLQCFHPSFLS
jgi:hypothetical protein